MATASTDIPAFQVAAWLGPEGADLVALRDSSYGPFTVQRCAPGDAPPAQPSQGCDVLILDERNARARDVGALAADLAVVIVTAQLDAARVLDWLQRGVQDVVHPRELGASTLALRLRAAIERKRLEREARTAYATDLDTGLPHQQQLIEHMSQLLALREREPAPMAVLALRVEGLAATQVRFGLDASNALRRKVGVRLRAGVRASDVVASLGEDVYAVLLGSILTPADAARVGEKLQKSLTATFRVAAQEVAVASAIGIGQYPQDGTTPEALLRRAVGLAAAAQAQGRMGAARLSEAGGAPLGAANDE
jgi:diguanylate cyclase (GGDEF)-like protein